MLRLRGANGGWPHQVSPWLLTLAMLWPSLITFIYFVLLRRQATHWQQIAYVLGKGTQFALPILLCCLPAAPRCSIPPVDPGQRTTWRRLGIASGVLFAMIILGGYFLVLRHSDGLADLPRQLVSKLHGLGMATRLRFLLLSLFYCVVHSFLEEYYWRWFIFRQWTSYVPTTTAILLSSLAFMAHHVVLLGILLGWTSWIAYLSSLGVAVGGVFWAWLYHRSGSLVPAWLSHCIVDAAIMGIGYITISSQWATSSA